MSGGAFARALAERRPAADGPDGRRWVFVPYDQLTDAVGPLAEAAPEELGIVVVECPAKAARRPVHKQKLLWILTHLRHFALEQAQRGVAVRHVVAPAGAGYADALEPLAAELGPLTLMRPAERELRVELAPLVEAGALEVVPHAGWLTDADDFRTACGDAPWRMDAFYRHVRRRTGQLMDGDSPAGGRFSFDGENRERWTGEPAAPTPPSFEPDEVTAEVVRLIETRFARHPGELDSTAVPATPHQIGYFWSWVKRECLPCFGPYEDAMSRRSTGLFHARVSTLVHLHRLLPQRVVTEVAELDAPLASREGFVRQVLGWREFVRHVHEATDGFRDLPDGAPETLDRPGDGGWSRWSGERWLRDDGDGTDGGAAPSHLGADGALPPAFWGTESGLACLDTVVGDVWREGWSHHITRLMVLSNLATLLDVRPRELTDWFWAAYHDAFDWVVEPNVLGMGTFGAGELMTTKPYVSGTPYLHRMGDYCETCAFDPRKDCPISSLYWAFLGRHRARLEGNPRLTMPLASLKKRKKARRAADRRTFERVRETLERGERLEPETTTEKKKEKTERTT